MATPAGYDEALSAIAVLVAELELELGERATVGVGTPGSVSPTTGLMRNANSTWLNGRPFREDLETALARPVRLANDANCLALSEALDGAAAGARCVFAVILGTGCGGGLAIDGRLVEGASGIAGEWGHTPLPWVRPDEHPGPDCWCGRKGCLETWISGSGLARDHASRNPGAGDAQQIVGAARLGEPSATRSLELYVDRLGRGLAVICDIVDPDVIVLGGGMSNVVELYDRLPICIAPHIFSDGWRGRLAPARWGDASGVRGAARLWSLSESV